MIQLLNQVSVFEALRFLMWLGICLVPLIISAKVGSDLSIGAEDGIGITIAVGFQFALISAFYGGAIK